MISSDESYKNFRIAFSRDHGHCFDEIIYIINATSLKDAIKKATLYKDKYLSEWYMDVEEIIEDSEGFFMVSETYGQEIQ